MIRIRQHGDAGEHFDMGQFIDDIEEFYVVEYWIVDIEWALGRNGERADETALRNRRYSNKGLRSLYRDIYQTIDGTITGYAADSEIARFQAVDSAYWFVSSSNVEFLDYLEKKYGNYEGFAA